MRELDELDEILEEAQDALAYWATTLTYCAKTSHVFKIRKCVALLHEARELLAEALKLAE